MDSSNAPSVSVSVSASKTITLLFVVLLAACAPQPRQAALPFSEGKIDFTHKSGASGKFYMPEIMGSGAALFDADNDGDLDALLVQSVGKTVLFTNDGVGNFTASGRINFEGYGMGVATADIDNDGDTDVLITAFDGNALFRNNGDGTFTETASDIKLPKMWSSSAAFFDYDRDGWLDLVILNYVDYSYAINKPCQAPTGETDYCTPRAYRSLPSHLFHNEKGRFVEVPAFRGAAGPALGVVAFDANNDGWLDLFIANDSAANHLWINNHDGTFSEQALKYGVAYSDDGLAKAGMGVALGDYDNDGDEDLIVLNLMREGATLFQNNGATGFSDVSAKTGILNLTSQFTGFGVGWIDVDRDGKLDLLMANGAVTRREDQRNSGNPFLERNLLLRNIGEKFEDMNAFPAFGVSRGAAFGDIDNDGDIDVLINVNNAPARLLRNEAPKKDWLSVEGPELAKVEVKTKNGKTQTRWIRTASSYLSANERRANFVLNGEIDTVTLTPFNGQPRKLEAKKNAIIK